jgi:PLP dependent protein
MTTSPASYADPADVARVAANLATVHQRIRDAGGDPAGVQVVAVTKGFDASMVRCAAAVGLVAVGENYVDELETKRAGAGDLGLSWHFLGALQSNKIVRVVHAADVISGVSREKEIRRIAAVRPGATIDVQVDLTGAPRRHGAGPEEVAGLVAVARSLGLDVRGLMTVASPEASRAAAQFARVDEMAAQWGLRGRSMGMSDDLELAVAAGSTEIRVGRALFGPRTPHTALA